MAPTELYAQRVGDGDGPPSGRWLARGRAGSAIVFGEADPPLVQLARDTPATTAVEAAVSAARKEGRIDLNRPRAVRASPP